MTNRSIEDRFVHSILICSWKCLLWFISIAYVRLPANEVAKSTIQEGPQYSFYKKRDQIWCLKLKIPSRTGKVNPSVLGNWSYWKKSSSSRHKTRCCSIRSNVIWFNCACWRTTSDASNFNNKENLFSWVHFATSKLSLKLYLFLPKPSPDRAEF